MSIRSGLFPLALIISLAVLPLSGFGANAPSEIGGFKLGEDITEYSDIEYSNYLKEVIVNNWHGFEKGIIYYGTCAYPGMIVKITMSYADSSKDFYDDLLLRYKARYGKPTEWKGDAFGILYVWKWSFIDDKQRRVELVLQHNLQNLNENLGNVVKLSFPDRELEEQRCFDAYCEANESDQEKELIEKRMEPDWQYMIPR